MSSFEYHPPTTIIEIIYQDEQLLLVNKPSGLLSVPGRLEQHKDSVVSRLLCFHEELYPVHRLDMDTSGLMLLAKTKAAHSNLSKQFQLRQVVKLYQALVWGIPLSQEGKIELPLICDWPNRPRQKICEQQGKYALTYYKIIKTFYNDNNQALSYMALYPKTGRSHQLRVHMQALGHPILGCEFYAHENAQKAANRLMLHASNLSITHPIHNKPLSWQCLADFWDIANSTSK